MKVLKPRPQRPVPRRSSFSYWRAAVLIGVHLLMVGHVLHWWITGRSVGRFVLSDSMRTLELGEINPGAILFALSILFTALFGRFMCGWICHIGALQDVSAWLLRKFGIRPHLFRSRLLAWVPLGLAAYMFLWPTFKRLLLGPALKTVWPDAAASFTAAPFPGFSLDLTTEHLWDGLPSLWVGIPFLLVAGFLIVFFLGARGLCRYACPYGGFLLPAEQLSVGRVVVDPSKCDQCGLCTAACTTGVRVHDEVREYGSVVDRNCIKSFDCVGACPQKALSFALTSPAIISFNHSKNSNLSRYDLTWTQEFVCLAVFLGSFLTLRGLYQQLPLLMSAPLAIVVAYLSFKTMRLLQTPNVTFASAQLRLGGRLTRSGRLFIAAVASISLFLLHSAAIRGLIWRAEQFDNLVNVSFEDALSQTSVTELDRENAARSLKLYRLADSCWQKERAGFGLAITPEVLVRISWLELVSGRPQIAINELERLNASGRAHDSIIAELAILLHRQGMVARSQQTLQDALLKNPTFSQSRDLFAALLMQESRPADAEQLYRSRLADRPTDVLARTGLARLLFTTGRQSEAIAQFIEATHSAPGEAVAARDYVLALSTMGRIDEAIAELHRCAKARPQARLSLFSLGAQILRASGREIEAQALDAAHTP